MLDTSGDRRERAEISFAGQKTISALFRARVAQWGDRVAMRDKELGVWRDYNWNDYDRFARQIAAGLIADGFQPGQVAAILSETCKEWVFADMGVHLSGGTVNGIYPTYQPGQLEYALNDSAASVLFVEDEEQLDKFLAVRDRLPGIRRVYVFDWKGLRNFDDPLVVPLDELLRRGAALRAEGADDEIDARVDAVRNEDTAILIYTSGTTGRPKGARIPHSYLLFQMSMAPDPLPVGEDDDVLTYLPLCHAAERLLSPGMSLGHGLRMNFAESSETVFQNIQELSPTFLFAVPRIWEKFYSRVSTLMAEATWAGRAGYRLALAIGYRRADLLIAGRPIPLSLRLAGKAADALVFRNLKLLLGLDRARVLLSGAAPISAELIRWYLAMGLPMAEIYGQTETGFATMTRKGEVRPGTIGHPGPGIEVKLGEQDEILVRSPGMFSGYLNMPEATGETLVEGWVRTGDVGRIDPDGSFRIADRLKDIIITAGGKNITPSQIENQLKFSPYISDATVIGDKRKYLSCLIMIDRDNVEHYAQTRSIPFTDYRSLCARPEVVKLVGSEVARVNSQFSPVEQIKAFRLIDVMLTPEDEELTPTMKLKRSFVAQKYAPLIEQMY
ncbi:AMP-dependent synthetase/ligase [Paracoccus marinus]|uniref:AMP-dependent synthetase/ligase n=1 Tax=Paracoccus marinus TaxID=288426 RepID=UPI00103C655E|nr:AMP-binding protein [Paracoccus marinus]GLS79613.1 fatty-acid--CoA ligase [Paracoccus marinus]